MPLPEHQAAWAGLELVFCRAGGIDGEQGDGSRASLAVPCADLAGEALSQDSAVRAVAVRPGLEDGPLVIQRAGTGAIGDAVTVG